VPSRVEMGPRVFAWLLGLSAAEGFLPTILTRRALPIHKCQLAMISAENIAKKAAVVEEVEALMDKSSLMFCVRTAGVQVNELNDLRQKLPEGVSLKCTKNTLVKRAAQAYPRFQNGDSLLEYSNYWFFVPEGDMREAVELWNDFAKESGKKKEREIVGGMFEGQALDADGIVAVTKLPTKQEQMGKTAVLLKMLPSKLARVVKEAGAVRIARGLKEARGSKLSRAVKGMSDKLG